MKLCPSQSAVALASLRGLINAFRQHMYDVAAYGKMIADELRMSAYAAALKECVSNDSVVVDIGTGTGIFALLACKLGARKVFAIEPSDAIALARETATANGFENRIEFIQDVSTRVSLPEPGDVIISDMRGVLPFLGQHIPSVIDARRRLLRPDGVLIPESDTLWAAVVDGGELYKRYREPWESEPFGLDLRAGRRYVVNSWRKACVGAEELLSTEQCWATLDYRTIDDVKIRGEIHLAITKRGLSHGLSVWFNSILHGTISLTNHPEAPELIYGRGFFPWERPVEVDAGDHVIVELRADLVGDDYVWRWSARFFCKGSSAKPKAEFNQSTFAAGLVSPSKLRKVASSFVPKLSEDGELRKFILSLFDGTRSIENVAREVHTRFPNRFQRWEQALDEVSKVSVEFS
jgi:protein arginine N-methyltransferase 1